MKLFQYAVLLHPSDEEKKNGVSTKLIVPVTTILAEDQSRATLLAGRAIQEEYLDKLSRIEVAVRPF